MRPYRLFLPLLVAVTFYVCFVQPVAAQSLHPSGAVAVTRAGNATTLTGAAESEFAALVNRPPGVTVFNNLLNRAYIPASQGGTGIVSAAERYAINMAGGAEMEVLLTRGVTAGGIAAGAVALGGAAWAGAQIGAPISKALGNDTLDIGDTRCTATNTGWKCDDGGPPTPQDVTQYRALSSGNILDPTWQPTRQAALTAVIAWYAAHGSNCNQPPDTRYHTECTSAVQGDEWYMYTHTTGPQSYDASAVDHHGPFESRTVNANSCPATFDALNPAWSRQAGDAPDSDGKCNTGRYSTPTTQDMINKLRDGIGRVAAPVAADLLRDVITGGGTVPTPDPGVLTGPASTPGTSTTTTTTPSGGGAPVTTTTTTGNTYTYNGPTVTTVTNTTVNNGDTTTTTTTTPPPPETKNCGLPTTPPCKIDETGTPTQAPTTADAPFEAAKGQIVDGISGSAGTTSLPFTWSLGLPAASCTPFHFWKPGADDFIADPCSSSGVALWRTLLAWFVAALTGLHIWRTVVEIRGG